MLLDDAVVTTSVPGPWDFWQGKDSISGFVTGCWWALYLLCWVATVALSFVAIDRGVEHAVLVLGLLIGAVLALFIPAVGHLVYWLHGHMLWWENHYWPVVFVLACTVYLFFLTPYLPAFFAVIGFGYLLLVRLNVWVVQAIGARSSRLVRIVKAVFRSTREYLLLTAAGYGFVLMGQILILIWSGLHHDGIWVWERIVRRLALLPELKWWFVIPVLLSLAGLSLLNPKLEAVRRATAAIKVYKQILALIVVMASFTFFTAKTVAALHHEFLLERHPQEVAPRTREALQLVRRESYLQFRIEAASSKERESLREELLRLEREPSLKQRDAGVLALRDELGGIETGDIEQTETGARSIADDAREHVSASCGAGGVAVYAECREAIVQTFETLLGSYKPKTGDELLDSIAEVLLDNTYSPVLDSVVPDELSEGSAMRAWFERHAHRRDLAVSSSPPEPEWGAVLAAEGLAVPRIGVLPDEEYTEGSPREGEGRVRIRVRIKGIP